MKIIFDLGKVILPFDPIKPSRILAEMVNRTPLEIVDLIYNSGLEYDFEKGLIDGRQFTDGLSERLEYEIDYDWWKKIWSDMFEENEDVSSLILRLKDEHNLSLLSNTNEWHWEYVFDKYPILKQFEHYTLSFEVKAMKPEAEIYHHALSQGEDQPALFIDDMQRNVDGANQAGLPAIKFESAEQLIAELTNRKVL